VQKQQITVSIASDDPATLPKAVAHLRTHGYKIITAMNCTRAAVLARSEMPDIIVPDLDAPFDLCRAIKRRCIPMATDHVRRRQRTRPPAREVGGGGALTKAHKRGRVYTKHKRN